ncbi:DinB family protein [Gordonia phthalatica]|uniref:Methyltransferase type 12 n=1 Tax=Gordonia phthalatica TaxID=1136941 RepID=A0A0N9NAH7_9ACTN|nr:DinB family protein [Gordonia phthalatica]ALG84009.1 methyltransferase type 12 [Gordonia phthalatica]
MTIKPDTKDWTWVIALRCSECGFDPAEFRRAEICERILATVDGWREVLARPDVTHRPNADTWSPLEYACHVRDVNAVMTERLEMMLQTQPVNFADWDQNSAEAEAGYNAQDPETVADQLEAAAKGFAELYRVVGDDDWARQGMRSNGSPFTVETLGIYAVHDLEHHRVDVGLPARA